jgi:hypothetical protein
MEGFQGQGYGGGGYRGGRGGGYRGGGRGGGRGYSGPPADYSALAWGASMAQPPQHGQQPPSVGASYIPYQSEPRVHRTPVVRKTIDWHASCIREIEVRKATLTRPLRKLVNVNLKM